MTTPDEGRQGAAALRDQAGRRRDVMAHWRDQAGEQRDRVADLQDQLADEREQVSGTRSAPALDRDRARQDRGAGANDRVDAEQDRSSAAADRSAAARDRWHASIDGLTGVYSREAGLVELDRELARVQRIKHHLVVAFVDVDHLKVINDARGHAAGDRLLVAVAKTLQTALRPYDLIIRYGGDEFLCAVQDIDLATARPRFGPVNTLLAHTAERASVTVGLAQCRPGENSRSLIARADADLYRQRRPRSHGEQA